MDVSHLLARRINQTQPSFIHEIFKVMGNPEVISFAGGLPNPDYFPFDELGQAAQAVFARGDRSVLQYANTKGFLPLREWIVAQYKAKSHLDIDVDDVLITTGSQQGLDLIGKVFLNQGDTLLMEEPGYLGAIQAFEMYEPTIRGVPIHADKLDTKALDALAGQAKFFYTVPNYQNPTGFSTQDSEKREIAEIIRARQIFLIEDDPYGEISFGAPNYTHYRQFIPEQTVLLGSFSKIISPGMRLGWVIAPKPVIAAIEQAKQAVDLHSNYLMQAILAEYLQHNDVQAHISTIGAQYKKQCDYLAARLEKSAIFKGLKVSQPRGGMFLWAKLPTGQSGDDLLPFAIAEKVIYVPGSAFSIERDLSACLRLNFSNADTAQIEKGVERLERAYATYLAQLPQASAQTAELTNN